MSGILTHNRQRTGYALPHFAVISADVQVSYYRVLLDLSRAFGIAYWLVNKTVPILLNKKTVEP